jgi:hypothetical protein
MIILLILGVILILVAGGLLWSGRRTQRKVNLLRQAVPTTAANVAGAFPGELVSLTGNSRAERELLSEHSQTPCVYYESSVIREYERTERTAGSRNRPGRTRRSRTSETISSNSGSVPFFIEDESGKVRVVPDGAEFDAREVLNRFDPSADAGPSVSIGGFNMNLGTGSRTLGYRYKESIIPVDDRVFVLGVVDESGQISRPGNGRENASLIVSYRDEASLRDAWRRSARWQAYGSIGSAAVGVILIVTAAISSIV